MNGSAFNVPAAPLIPFVGKIYAICSTKLTFLLAQFIFEVGSLLSAVAPTSIASIVGRALSGAGSAGIFNGALVTITMISPLDKRPAYQSVMGGILLETGNSTVTPVVSNLRPYPTLGDSGDSGYFTFLPLLPSSVVPTYLLDSSTNISTCLSTLVSSYAKRYMRLRPLLPP